jgi:hypothetical protein
MTRLNEVLTLLLLVIFSTGCLAGKNGKKGKISPEAMHLRKRLDDFLASVNPETLERKSAAEVINEGKKLLYEILMKITSAKLYMK